MTSRVLALISLAITAIPGKPTVIAGNIALLSNIPPHPETGTQLSSKAKIIINNGAVRKTGIA